MSKFLHVTGSILENLVRTRYRVNIVPTKLIQIKLSMAKNQNPFIWITSFNPFCPGGDQIDPHLFWADITGKLPGQSGWNFLTFPIYPLTKDLNKEIFYFFYGGTPTFAPERGGSPKNEPPWLPMTSLFYCRIFFYCKNGDVRKTRRNLHRLRRVKLGQIRSN